MASYHLQPMSTVPERRRPRTQAERREATQTALLDATIECLVAHGYANTTTARVADLAGLSRGAQVHYFPSKAALVAAAVEHLARKRIEELRGPLLQLAARPNRVELLLDVLWESHKGEIFDATLELWVASRTDPELHTHLVGLERNVAGAVAQLTVEVLPDEAARPEFRDDVMTALATVRGLALLRIAAGDNPSAMTRRWKAARKRLVRLFEQA